jgi:hypothetical protein
MLMFIFPHGYQDVRCHTSQDHVPLTTTIVPVKSKKGNVGLVVKAMFTNLVSMAETLLTKRLKARKWTAGSKSSITAKLLSRKVLYKEPFCV